MSTTRAEYALVAGLAVRRFALEDTASLRPEDFSSPRCARVLGALRELAAEGRLDGDGVDPSLLCDRARIQPREFSELLDALPEAQSAAPVYVQEIRKASALRDLGRATRELKKRTSQEAAAHLKDALARYEETQVGSRPLPLITAPALVAEPQEEAEWLVKDLLRSGIVALLVGAPGSTKTFFALAVAVAVAFGRDLMGRPCVQRPVVFVNADSPDSLIRDRLRMLGPAPNLTVWPNRADPPLLESGTYTRLLEVGEQPLIILDTLRRLTVADENSSTEMAPVMAALRALAARGATVLILHHSTKEGSLYRGSSEILAAVDMAWSLKHVDDHLELATVKDRFGPPDFRLPMHLSVVADYACFVDLSEQQAAEQRGQKQERLKALADLIAEMGTPNQTQIVERAFKDLGMKRREVLSELSAGLNNSWVVQPGPRHSVVYRVITNCSSCSGTTRDNSDKSKAGQLFSCPGGYLAPGLNNSDGPTPEEVEDEGEAYVGPGREF